MIAHGKLVAVDDPQKLEKDAALVQRDTLTTDATEDELRENHQQRGPYHRGITGNREGKSGRSPVLRPTTTTFTLYPVDVFLAFTKSKM
jgi:ABC-2 type transport system ATP-binding protein